LTPTKFQNIGQTDFANSYWFARGFTKVGAVDGPLGYTGYEFAENNTNSNPGILPYTNLSDGSPKTFSVWLKASSPVSIALATTGSVKTSTINVTTEWQFFQCTDSTNGGSGPHIGGFSTITQGSGITLFAAMPQFEEGTTASDFVANTTGSPKFITGPTFGPRVPMILVEPSATNSFLYSQPTSALAFGGGGIRTFDAATAPNGETEAFRITNNGTSGNHNYRATSSITFGSDSMVLSVWAKAGSGGNNYFTWSFQNLGGAVVRAGFKLEGDGETQIITNGNGGHTLQIETYPDGWYRCIIIGNTQSSGTTTQFLYTVSGYTEHSSIAGGSVLLWGFQVESGSVATSYIPTSGSTVTRAADDLEISGSAFSDFFNATEGTVYAEFLYDHDQTSKYVYSISETGNNEIRSQILSSSLRNRYVVNSSNVANLEKSGILRGSLNRSAFSYKTNNFRLNLNGTTDSEQLSGTASINPVRLSVGNRSLGNHLNGRIRRILYWPYSSDRL
jgi:hypothetical protein